MGDRKGRVPVAGNLAAHRRKGRRTEVEGSSGNWFENFDYDPENFGIPCTTPAIDLRVDYLERRLQAAELQIQNQMKRPEPCLLTKRLDDVEEKLELLGKSYNLFTKAQKQQCILAEKMQDLEASVANLGKGYKLMKDQVMKISVISEKTIEARSRSRSPSATPPRQKTPMTFRQTVKSHRPTSAPSLHKMQAEQGGRASVGSEGRIGRDWLSSDSRVEFTGLSGVTQDGIRSLPASDRVLDCSGLEISQGSPVRHRQHDWHGRVVGFSQGHPVVHWMQGGYQDDTVEHESNLKALATSASAPSLAPPLPVPMHAPPRQVHADCEAWARIVLLENAQESENFISSLVQSSLQGCVRDSERLRRFADFWTCMTKMVMHDPQTVKQTFSDMIREICKDPAKAGCYIAPAGEMQALRSPSAVARLGDPDTRTPHDSVLQNLCEQTEAKRQIEAELEYSRQCWNREKAKLEAELEQARGDPKMEEKVEAYLKNVRKAHEDEKLQLRKAHDDEKLRLEAKLEQYRVGLATYALPQAPLSASQPPTLSAPKAPIPVQPVAIGSAVPSPLAKAPPSVSQPLMPPAPKAPIPVQSLADVKGPLSSSQPLMPPAPLAPNAPIPGIPLPGQSLSDVKVSQPPMPLAPKAPIPGVPLPGQSVSSQPPMPLTPKAPIPGPGQSVSDVKVSQPPMPVAPKAPIPAQSVADVKASALPPPLHKEDSEDSGSEGDLKSMKKQMSQAIRKATSDSLQTEDHPKTSLSPSTPLTSPTPQPRLPVQSVADVKSSGQQQLPLSLPKEPPSSSQPPMPPAPKAPTPDVKASPPVPKAPVTNVKASQPPMPPAPKSPVPDVKASQPPMPSAPKAPVTDVKASQPPVPPAPKAPLAPLSAPKALPNMKASQPPMPSAPKAPVPDVKASGQRQPPLPLQPPKDWQKQMDTRAQEDDDSFEDDGGSNGSKKEALRVLQGVTSQAQERAQVPATPRTSGSHQASFREQGKPPVEPFAKIGGKKNLLSEVDEGGDSGFEDESYERVLRNAQNRLLTGRETKVDTDYTDSGDWEDSPR